MNSSFLPLIATDPIDKAHRVIFANESFTGLTGYSMDRLIGMPIGEILKSETDKQTRDEILKCLEDQASGNWEMQFCTSNGQELLVAVFLTATWDGLGSPTGSFLAMVNIGLHIDRVIQERNELHTIYKQAPGFIAISRGPEHRFTFANASYERFVGRKDLEGCLVAEALPGVAEQGFVQILDTVYTTGKPFLARDAAMKVLNPETGELEQKYADFVYQPVRSSDGTITGLFCEGYDVTVLHETAESLTALQSNLIYVSRTHAMGAMAMTLAHELNQPLSAIVSYAEGGLRRLDASNVQLRALHQALSGIESAASRAAEIIRNLRNFTAARPTAATRFGVRDAVGECVRLVQAVASPAVTILNSVPADLEIGADRIQIQQVLINLIHNSCEATASVDLQTVQIEAEHRGQDVLVSVIDSGTGISPETAQSLFTFSTSTKATGMGIGLSVSRTIVQAHGGAIWLEDGTPGKTTLCFTIPSALPPAQAT